MPLLDDDELTTFFARPFRELERLPNLLLEDLDLGIDRIRGIATQRGRERRPVIHIPAWDEIIHIVPEALLPEEEQARRRRDRARRIAESPIPESVRAIGSIMTWVDDVQDALLTAAVLTRLGAAFYKPLLPVATGLGAAAEAANIFGLAGAAAQVPLTGKFRATSAMRSLLGTQVVRGLRNRTLQRAIPTIGELIQVAQTTDQFFGIGLSLGPIMGLLQELIFGIPSGARFAFQSGIRYRPADELWLRRLDQERVEALQDLAPIGNMLRGAPAAAWLLATPDGPTFSERLDALVLLSITAELARGFLPESRWQPLLTPMLQQLGPASRQIRPRTALEIHARGIDPTAAETFPIAGNPKTLTIADQVDVLIATSRPEPPKWLQEAGSIPARLFAEQLATDLPFRWVRAFEGPDAGFEIHGTPRWRAVIDSLELGLRPPPDTTPAAIEAYLTAAAALYPPDGTGRIPTTELRALYGQHWSRTETKPPRPMAR